MKKIADVLNSEHIPTPMDHQYRSIGKNAPHDYTHIWAAFNVKLILNDPSEWIVIENNHEPIVPRKLWDKVRELEASVSRGKRDKKDDLAPLSGSLYCDSCGYKMKQEYVRGAKNLKYSTYTCGSHHHDYTYIYSEEKMKLLYLDHSAL